MKEEKIKELHNLFFEFNPLYFQKFMSLFNKPDDILPKCYKNQIKAMFIINDRERITLTELGISLDLQKGSLTSLIDSLVALKLVKRESEPSDRRKVWLVLTSQGKEYLEQKKQVHERNFKELFSASSEEKIVEFHQCLKKMIELLKDL